MHSIDRKLGFSNFFWCFFVLIIRESYFFHWLLWSVYTGSTTLIVSLLQNVDTFYVILEITFSTSYTCLFYP